MRFRFQGKGQVAGGNLEWYIAKGGELFGSKHRIVVLKSRMFNEYGQQ